MATIASFVEVNRVIRFIEGNKQNILDKLFPLMANGDTSYHDEWKARDVFSFWCHLDTYNARLVIDMANEHYKNIGG